ncbi:MAG: hypothetical protein HUK20_13880 [Fibrobacter sp.]|nr:hypothetical protein [Fibrobacter sp.]
MKNKIPAILFMLAVPLSVVVYLKVVSLSGSEMVGLFSAVGFYLIVFFVLALFFNSKAGKDTKATSALDEIEEVRNLAKQLGEVADQGDAHKK